MANKDTIIDELLAGSIDLHVHVGPDPSHRAGGTRRYDVAQVGEMAKAAGQPAVACKSHQQVTASLAALASRMVSGITLLGGITLNKTVGGLNPHAVRMAGELGARILWFPTHHAAHHNSTLIEGGQGDDRGIRVLDPDGKLLPEVPEILDLVRRYDMLLGTGHVSFPEAFAIVKTAKEKGIDRIIANHPLSKNSCRYTVAEAKQLADLGATVELTFVSLMPFTRAGRSDPKEMVEAIRQIGAERCLISTDFGAYATPPPPEGLRMFIATLLNHGMAPEDVELMARRNPVKLAAL
ncbi:MAG: DUF6282 family protein [Candidatus Binatia bacterium]